MTTFNGLFSKELEMPCGMIKSSKYRRENHFAGQVE